MNRKDASIRRIVLCCIALLAALSLAFQVPAASVPGALNLVGTWDRLNPGSPPEHEVLRCGGDPLILCVYDKQPEPQLNFTTPPQGTMGFFRGRDATMGWSCPSGLGEEACNNTSFVASGVMTYTLRGDLVIAMPEDLIVSAVGGQSVLYMYMKTWGVICPWYRGFDAALAANPFPLPYNGADGPRNDCIGA